MATQVKLRGGSGSLWGALAVKRALYFPLRAVCTPMDHLRTLQTVKKKFREVLRFNRHKRKDKKKRKNGDLHTVKGSATASTRWPTRKKQGFSWSPFKTHSAGRVMAMEDTGEKNPRWASEVSPKHSTLYD